MNELQGLGVQIAIDDFGTGYSSLSALKTFPVARLKIDKSFIKDVAHDENDQAVVSAVISLGQKLNMKVIAEGVETDDQVTFLLKNNCDEMQGYHFCKPISGQDIKKLLDQGHHIDRASMGSGLMRENFNFDAVRSRSLSPVPISDPGAGCGRGRNPTQNREQVFRSF
jgi:predicted signal transduction protein with EAL and GGDEF domain